VPSRISLLAVLSLGLLACGPAPGTDDGPLLVFAAASLADALEEVGGAWEAEHPGEPVDFSFAGSNDLARQIAAGAPADLFVAADRERLEMAGGGIDVDRAVALLGNELVVVVPAADMTGEAVPEVRSARDLLAFERLGLADPEAVPAGVYARRWLEASGVWEELAPRVVPALDVRANLAAVASGSVSVGVVYATDAVGGVLGRVRVVHRVAAPTVYWAAPVAEDRRGPHRAQVRAQGRALRFLVFLAGRDAGAIFDRHGFRHLPGQPVWGAGGV
jgi:molybdate transport system substrate-binding protein